jgi:hypothetical protein
VFVHRSCTTPPLFVHHDLLPASVKFTIIASIIIASYSNSPPVVYSIGPFYQHQSPIAVITSVPIHSIELCARPPSRLSKRINWPALVARFQILISSAAPLHSVIGQLGPGCSVSVFEIQRNGPGWLLLRVSESGLLAPIHLIDRRHLLATKVITIETSLCTSIFPIVNPSLCIIVCSVPSVKLTLPNS